MNRVKSTGAILVLSLLLMVTLLPFYIALLLSQKTNGEVHSSLWSLPATLRPEYYQQSWVALYPSILNSMIICIAIVAGVLVLSSLAGYAFARLKFCGKGVLFTAIIFLMMIPGILTLVPGYLWYKEFPFLGGNDWLGQGGSGLLNTRWVFILPFLSGGQILGIYLFRTAYESLPEDMFAAARIDGASELQIWRSIAIPQSLPIFATVAILTFVGIYNEYIWPLVTISDDAIQVFAVAVKNFSKSGFQMGPTFAGYMLGALPLILVFVFGMKYYVEGMSQGGSKE